MRPIACKLSINLKGISDVTEVSSKSVKKEIVKNYAFDSGINKSMLYKNNFLVDLEQYRDTALPSHTLSPMQWMVIQTGFYIVNQLRQSKRKLDFSADTEFSITLDEFCSLWGVTDVQEKKRSGALHTEISRALSKLRSIKLKYPQLNSNMTIESGYFAQIGYGNNVFSFTYPKAIVEYMQVLGSYTWYFFENIVKLQGNVRASILYEQISKHKYQNKAVNNDDSVEIEFSLDKLKRLLLDAGTEMPTKYFNSNILREAVNFINKNTSLEIRNVESVKSGKTIVAFIFTVKFDGADLAFKSAVSNDALVESFLSEEQRLKYAYKLVEMEGFVEKFKSGEQAKMSDMAFFKFINDDLADNFTVINKYYPYLKENGFTHKVLDALMKRKESALNKGNAEAPQGKVIEGESKFLSQEEVNKFYDDESA